MPDELPSGDKAVYVILEMIALGFILEAVPSFMRGDVWWRWVGALALGILFLVAGVKWPQIKQIAAASRFASIVEGIASKPLYRRTVYAVIVLIIFVSTGFRGYRHYYPLPLSAHKTAAPHLSTPALVKPTITWADPAPITFGSRLSSIQLDAKVNVDATPSYNHEIGEMLPVGRYELTVTFTPTDSTKYSTATQTVHLVVKAPKPRPHAAPPNQSDGSAQQQQSKPAGPAPSQSAPIAPPIQSPPRQSPDNAPTAYSELVAVRGKVDGLQGDWDLRTMPIRDGKGQSDDPNEAKTAFIADIIHAEDDILPQWARLKPDVLKAHDDAVKRMKSVVKGDPPSMTPNEEVRDATEFGKAIGEAETPTRNLILAGKPPNYVRFRALSKYLEKLIAKLGDYQ